MIAMGEGLGSQMALRALDHILQYGEVTISRFRRRSWKLLSAHSGSWRVHLPAAGQHSPRGADCAGSALYLKSS
jgi:hypothetical protein